MSQHALHKLANSRGELDRETLGTLYQISRRRSKKRPVLKRNGWRAGQGLTANLCVKIWSNEVHFPTSSSCVRKKLDDDTTFRATMLRLPLTTSFKVYLLPSFSKMLLLLSIQVLPLFIPSTYSLILKLAHQPNHSSIKSDSPKPRLCHVELRHCKLMDPPNPLGWFDCKVVYIDL